MTNEQFKLIHASYKTFSEIQELLRFQVGHVGSAVAETMRRQYQALEAQVPGLLLPFDPGQYADGRVFPIVGLQSYLASALSKLSLEIEEIGAPISETLEFKYVHDGKLRSNLESDYREIYRARGAKCWKSVMILAGGIIEAILLDALLQEQSSALGAKKAPKSGNIREWRLVELIDVAVELKLVGKGVDKLSHSVREYRNLVHPANAVSSGLTADVHEAEVAVRIIQMLDRDLR